jgi:hypothetical protein
MNNIINIGTEQLGHILKDLLSLKEIFKNIHAKYRFYEETATHFVLVTPQSLFEDKTFLKTVNHFIINFEEVFMNEGYDFIDIDEVKIFEEGQDLIEINEKGVWISESIISKLTNLYLFNKDTDKENSQNFKSIGKNTRKFPGIAQQINQELSRIIDENIMDSGKNESKNIYTYFYRFDISTI